MHSTTGEDHERDGMELVMIEEGQRGLKKAELMR